MTKAHQLDIFGRAHELTPEVSGRVTDPVSSHVTVRSLAKDGSYFQRVLTTVCSLYLGRPEGRPVTDDHVVLWMEHVYERRFQRNVIARTRGLLEPEYITRVGLADSPFQKIKVLHYVPTDAALRWYSKDRPTS